MIALSALADQATTSVEISGPDITGPVVSNIVKTDLTTTSVVISWTTHEATISSYFDYGTSTSSMSNTIEETYGTTSHQVDLTGLEEATIYFFQIRSEDALNNTSTYNYDTSGDDYSFTTLTNNPPVISNVTSTNRTQTTIDITWQTDEPATAYVDYGTSTLALDNTTGTSTLRISQSVSLSGLAQGTTYYFQVRSADGSGKESTDNNSGLYYYFTTRGPEIIVSDVEVDPLGTTTATINWTTNHAATSIVDYGLTTSALNTTASDDSSTTSHSLSLSGLSENTTYYYQIRGVDAIGDEFSDDNNGAYYSFTTATTPTPERIATGSGAVSISIKEPLGIGNLEIFLNNGASYTNRRDIDIRLKNFSHLSQIKFSEKEDLTDASWRMIAEKFFWQLTDQDGRKTLYFRFKNSQNQETNLISKSIILDRVPPSAPSDFKANSRESGIELTWLLPKEGDTKGVRIFKGEADFILNPLSQTGLVFEGRDEKAFDFDVADGKTYYYSAFAYDHARNYSNAALAKVIFKKQIKPKEPPKSQLPEQPGKLPPPSIEPEPEPPATEPKEIFTRQVKKVEIDVKEKKLPVEIEKTRQPKDKTQIIVPKKTFHYLERTPLNLVVEDDYIDEIPQRAYLYIGKELTYALERKEGKWQAKIETPPGKGTYEIKVRLIYEDYQDEVIIADLLVDPYGYVYQRVIEPYGRIFKAGLFSWKFNFKDIKIQNAKITLYQLDAQTKKWGVFDAENYGQENPQYTNELGQFGYMVPQGIYYLEVEKSGFGEAAIKPFEIKDQIINKNVKLSTVLVSWWRLKENLGLILILLAVATGITALFLLLFHKLGLKK